MQGFWLECGLEPLPGEGGPSIDHYILTPTVQDHLRSVARALWLRKYPVLLQGPTSAGKTSLVEYLAKRTGRTCVRINNHEHTNLQVGRLTTCSFESAQLLMGSIRFVPTLYTKYLAPPALHGVSLYRCLMNLSAVKS